MGINDLILYQDDSLIILNKPSGLRTIPDGYDYSIENLYAMLKISFPEIMVVHRLDKETSGVIIFARSREAHKHLNKQFEKRLVKKNYIAITHNIPQWVEYTCSLSLLVNGDRRHRTVINPSGKRSETYFVKITEDNTKNLCELKAYPRSGYTHQIRSHLNFLGYPILGDPLYNKNLIESQITLNKTGSRMMLHAESIEFSHPESNNQLIVTAKPPFSLATI